VLIGFFLPWIQMGGAFSEMMEAFGGKAPSFTGYFMATNKGPGGDPSYGLLFVPVVAIAGAAVHTKKGYVTCAILAVFATLLLGPYIKSEAAGMVSRGAGWFMVIGGSIGMLITAIIALPAPGNEPTPVEEEESHESSDSE
tara:strand:- start:1007 stop:1429 length:423 start_codon:yes stop_codon:yes gene_type:complete